MAVRVYFRVLSVPVLSQALTLLLLHHEPEVRRSAHAAAAGCVKQQPAALMLPLLEGLRHWMNAPAAVPTVLLVSWRGWWGERGGLGKEVGEKERHYMELYALVGWM